MKFLALMSFIFFSACNSDFSSLPTNSSLSLNASTNNAATAAATATPKPSATATPKPSATATPKPSATATPKPSVTPTATPTSAFNLPSQVCSPKIALDTTASQHVVGNGAGTCTEARLAAAIQLGGKITFNCGTAATTIPIATTLVLRNDVNTTIDGGGLITLDGANTTRIFSFAGTGWRTTQTKVTIQNLRFYRAKSVGKTKFATAPAPCSQGYEDGGGAAILFQDGILHVINSAFDNGAAASPGPDVAGGAIYSLGSIETIIQGSRFTDNTAANGGAIGSLNSNLTLYNNLFEANQATGTGGNNVNSTCPIVGGQREVGSGGNGGAVSIDGNEAFTVNVCGTTFDQNKGGFLGGAIFRTPDGAQQEIIFDRSTFNANTAEGGGAAYLHNSVLAITSSTLSNNVATGGGGAIQSDGTTINFVNSTFAGNIADLGLGGALMLSGNGGTILNCTFANNASNGGPGYFAAALGGFTPLTINNTVFENNLTKDAGSPMACAMGSSSGTDDLQWPLSHAVGSNPDSACASNAGTKFANSLLGALALNGGPTKTLLPGTGSPAIGAGTNCPSTDQRGKTRSTTKCTAGSVEP